MSRLVLLKGLAGDEPIDRLKCVKQVDSMPQGARITSAVCWQRVQVNYLSNVFGLELAKPPAYMVLPKKYDDRYYLENAIREDETGAHSHAIHSNSIEKGLLMVVLAFIFCKGGSRPGSPASMRWIADVDLYRLLHGLDENLPKDPPSVQNKNRRVSTSQAAVVDGNSPKVDVLMEQFVAADYLLKEKNSGDEENGASFYYTM